MGIDMVWETLQVVVRAGVVPLTSFRALGRAGRSSALFLARTTLVLVVIRVLVRVIRLLRVRTRGIAIDRATLGSRLWA